MDILIRETFEHGEDHHAYWTSDSRVPVGWREGQPCCWWKRDVKEPRDRSSADRDPSAGITSGPEKRFTAFFLNRWLSSFIIYNERLRFQRSVKGLSSSGMTAAAPQDPLACLGMRPRVGW